MDDEKLLAAAKQGDTSAFNQLVEKYHTELYYSALAVVRSRWDALDVCQDTFLKAYTSLGALNDISKFKTWINKILIHTCYDLFRRNKRLVYVEDIAWDELVENPREDCIDLINALGKLKKEFRIVLTLRYFQDLTIKEIAAVMDCPEGTVKSRVNHALKEMRRQLKVKPMEVAK